MLVKFNEPTTFSIGDIRLLPGVETELTAAQAKEFLANDGVKNRIDAGIITIIKDVKKVKASKDEQDTDAE